MVQDISGSQDVPGIRYEVLACSLATKNVFILYD